MTPQEFIEEVLKLCRLHGYSISHEDGHGAFEIEPWSEGNEDWLRNADTSDAEKHGPNPQKPADETT